MKPTKKIKSTRGIALAEVLLVVALMVILLGIAVPDIIGYSKIIKLTAMNDNARAVAVAVQSKLYSMKNSGTSKGSEYAMLNTEYAADTKNEIIVGKETVEGEIKNKKVKYVCSWDAFNTTTTVDKEKEDNEKKNTNMRYAKEMLLSGAITDVELLKNGKIMVVYDPDTADIWYVYYSDKEFDVEELLSLLTPDPDNDKPDNDKPDNDKSSLLSSFLSENIIGQYIGEPSPVPQYKATLPRFSSEWVFDDEMYLQLTMVDIPDDSILNKPLGLEVFAKIPKIGGGENEYDNVMIYAEGFFATDYKTTYAGTIAADYRCLTLGKIRDNKNHLRFALDSLVAKKAGYGAAYPYLQHQTHPLITSMADDLLYPRNAVATWFDGQKNPYLTVYSREEYQHSTGVDDLLHNGAPVTDYVPVDKSMSLTVKLHVLSDYVRPEKGKGDDETGSLYNFDDETYPPVEVESENMSPYFYALSGDAQSVSISSMRDYGNLSYVFNDPKKSKSITSANLAHDISGQQFYDKLVKTRYAAIIKVNDVIYANKYVCPDCGCIWKEENHPEFCPNEHKNSKGETIQVALKKAIDDLMEKWTHFANRDAIDVDSMIIANRTNFTINGKNPQGGNYAISNVNGGGRNTLPGGFFYYAENVTFKNIDIVNPRSWRNNCVKNFLSKPNEIALDLDSVVSGSLVGIAVNCQFDNVHAYIDSNQSLKVEDIDGGLVGDLGPTNKLPQNISERRVEGTVVGGLVGLAIGGENDVGRATSEKTSFDKCSASALLTTGLYYAPSQCVYAGGLVGIAFGSVDIENSYAASSLNGYYSGGLVGFATNGTWSYDYNNNLKRGIDRTNNATGTLTMNNSFSAGHINRLTRIGAGLIADYNYSSGSKPNVSNCYSAVNWDALPPVAYGTFKGDTAGNYYVSQTDLSLPITANVEAHFEVTAGDVFSLQGTGENKSGIPCTAEGLNDKFSAWKTAEATSRWRYYNATNDLTDTEKNEKYPFPMLESNNKFWGDWITDYYSEIDGVSIGDPKAALVIKFDKYNCPLYEYDLDWGRFPIHVDTGRIQSEIQNLWVNADWYWQSVIPSYVTFNDPVLVGGYQTTDKAIQESVKADLNDKSTGESRNFSYWARGAVWTEPVYGEQEDIEKEPPIIGRKSTSYGQGIDGATSVTLEGPYYKICGAPFYDPEYNPITGYNFKPNGTGISLGVSQLNWDYYGFYCCAIYGEDPGADVATTKYYIKFDNTIPYDENHTVNAKIGDDGFVHVNGDEFKKALKYYNCNNDESFLLPIHPENNLDLVWENGYFQVSKVKNKEA